MVVVGSDPLALAGVGALLDRCPRVDVVAEARPEELDEVEGAEVALWVDSDPPRHRGELPAVVLVPLDDAEHAERALDAGARGVVPRDASERAVQAALDAAAAGLVAVPPELLPTRATPAGSTTLTPREAEVLELVALGLSNREIGLELGVSAHTAKFHVASLLDKLGATTRTEAVVLAAREGLLTL